MTADKNDKNNWVVARILMPDNGAPCPSLVILHNEQAENKARELAEIASLDDPGNPVFLYQRVGTVITEPKAKWL